MAYTTNFKIYYGKILFIPGWQLVLMKITCDQSITDIAKETDLFNAIANKICKPMMSRGLLTMEKIGKRNKITLTAKGKELQDLLGRMHTIMKND